MDLKELETVSGAVGSHWYFQSKAWAIEALIKGLSVSSILDVGSGSGFFSRYLLQCSSIQEAYCVDIGYAKDWDEIEGNKTIHFQREIHVNNAQLVLMMDVLEHVDDDLALLNQYVDISRKGTYFLITVPAFSFLWSTHDEFLDHRRRYTLNQLQDLAIKSGLMIESKSYFFGLVFPLAAVIRLTQKYLLRGRVPVSQLDTHSSIINRFLKAVCWIELCAFRINRLAGLSACVMAKKIN
jgi:SAM-dependent methyltransferase